MRKKLLFVVLLACAVGAVAAEKKSKKPKTSDDGQAAPSVTAEAVVPRATGDQALTDEELDAKIAKLQALKGRNLLSEKGQKKFKDLQDEKDRRLLLYIYGITDFVYKKVEDTTEPLGEGHCHIYANMMKELANMPRLEKVTQIKALWYLQFGDVLDKLRGPAKLRDEFLHFEKLYPLGALTDPQKIAKHEELKAQAEQAAKVYALGVEAYKRLYKDRDKFRIEKKKKKKK